MPETGLQGRVSIEDHQSGRAALGYTCNTELVGSRVIPAARGFVGGFKVERYVDTDGHDCAYYDVQLVQGGGIADGEAGVNVLDMLDPARPVLTASLRTPAMLSPHESLVVSDSRGLMAAASGNPATQPGTVDVYDIYGDCRYPQVKASAPIVATGHESGISPDGNTFYVASPGTPNIVPVDLTNPSLPTPLGVVPFYSHGLSISADGNRAYLASVGVPNAVRVFSGGRLNMVPDPNEDRGLVIVDVSEFQSRKPGAQAREVSRVTWRPGSTPQNAMPFTSKGKPYLLEIDEFGQGEEVGAGRIIDISDETQPVVVSNLRLEVHDPANFPTIAGDPGQNFNGQGYSGHYCGLPTTTDPTIVACAMVISGLRVFDIRDVEHPKEVAYFNAPLQPRVPVPTPSSHYAMSQPSFVPERKEIWYTDVYSGFYAVRVTNGAWPD